MLKPILILLIFISSQFNSIAQNFDHIEYKKDCNLAYISSLDNKEFKTSIQILNRTKDKYGILYCEEYVLMAYSYKKLKNNNRSAQCLKKAWSSPSFDFNCLMQIIEIQPNEIMSGFSKRQKKIVKEGFKNFAKLKNNTSDSLTKIFEYLDSLDQLPRLINESNDSLFSNQKYTSIKNTDSLNLIEFKNIILKFGYPGSKLIPGNCLIAFLMLTHSSGYQNFYDEMKPILFNEVKKGNMPPSDYVLWLDRHNHYFNLPLEFGILNIKNQNEFSEIEKTKIYQKRLEFGLIKPFPLPSTQLTFE